MQGYIINNQLDEREDASKSSIMGEECNATLYSISSCCISRHLHLMSIASHVDFDQNIDYVMGGNARIYIVNNQLDEREDVSESSIMGKEGMQLYSISRRCISRQLHLMSIASQSISINTLTTYMGGNSKIYS